MSEFDKGIYILYKYIHIILYTLVNLYIQYIAWESACELYDDASMLKYKFIYVFYLHIFTLKFNLKIIYIK